MQALDAWSAIMETHLSEAGTRFILSFNEGLRTSAARDGGFAWTNDDHAMQAVIGSMVNADVYAISADIVAVTDTVAPTCPHHPVLLGDEMPSRIGFAWFEEPLIVRDIHDKQVRFHAVSWHPTGMSVAPVLDGAIDDGRKAPGVVLMFYSRSDDMEDDYSREIAESPKHAALDAVLPTPWRLSTVQYYPSDQNAIPEDYRSELAMQVHFETKESWNDPRNIIKWMISLWMVIKERMTTIEDVDAPRASRRRAQRLGIPPNEISRIKVVDLSRRVSNKTRGEAGGEGEWYSHRFPVRAHWRRQPYGPGRKLRRLQLINSYIKGPEDAPFIDKTTVFDVHD
jgi:hypothetical protein